MDKKNNVVAFSSDHAGFELKENLKQFFIEKGYEIVDLGPSNGVDSVSYAEQGKKLSDYMTENGVEKGIAVCGTGLGISYALNRHKGIRAARVTSVEDAHLAKQHNNANVLVFGGRQVSGDFAREMTQEWLNTEFEGGRHLSRIEELDK
ncbi:RpiB/LacA/LacB family sugar-phosphate isomerase [Mycoplasma sp. Ms02]|uniref:RpiB/LacA/LacB family sugar-phosphate isomerase n=1 Tax=Mycoplasma sp. Ms02 TaxID=353851 RepID=UPI001C8A57C1|nr:RpiB/LacA/LacB family sugar-phosphate isomerase [Mycoplasma sp. Ms02]QZE12097.1 RpiB/LacA/LacB family sugar-phosphate isomerase [Mycoplasma sp. Ms02]